MNKNVYYFGCWGDSGHCLFDQNRTALYEPTNLPWTWKQIDSVFPPAVRHKGSIRKEFPEGHASLTHEKGWTIIAFWDRSVDSRGGSNSAFFVHGKHSFEDAVKISKAHFPRVWNRFQFEVILVQGPDGKAPVDRMTLEEKAAAYESMRQELEEERKKPCVLKLGSTFAYLKDDTKILIKRSIEDTRKVWLEVTPTAIIIPLENDDGKK